MLALHTSFDTNGMMMDQMALANATEQRRQMFDIAFEEETSSSQQQQQQQQQTPPAPAMRMKAAAKPEEMKPELGQGFFKDLEIFIEREPPIAVGFLFLFLINGRGGDIYAVHSGNERRARRGVWESSRRVEERNHKRNI